MRMEADWGKSERIAEPTGDFESKGLILSSKRCDGKGMTVKESTQRSRVESGKEKEPKRTLESAGESSKRLSFESKGRQKSILRESRALFLGLEVISSLIVKLIVVKSFRR